MHYIKKRLQHRCFPVKFPNFFRYLFWRTFPANIRLDEDVLKTSLVFVFRRRLDQDEHIRYTHTSSEDVFKTSSRRLDQGQYIRLGHTSSRRLQDIFKTSSKRLQDVFKTSSRRLAKMSSRRFQGESSSYTVLVNKFSRCLQDVLTTFLRRTAKTVIYRRICLGHTSKKSMVSAENLQGWQQFLKF